jgi:hypothetical protein
MTKSSEPRPVRLYSLRINGETVATCYARTTRRAIQRFVDNGYARATVKNATILASDIAYLIDESDL